LTRILLDASFVVSRILGELTNSPVKLSIEKFHLLPMEISIGTHDPMEDGIIVGFHGNLFHLTGLPSRGYIFQLIHSNELVKKR
jgi:hypothetical protein